MTLIQPRLLIRGSLILIIANLTGCAGVYRPPYSIGGYGNQGANYGRQYYGYPAQGNGYYPSRSYNTYSYPTYYSRHGHDDDDDHEGRYEREHEREHDRD